MYNRYIPGADGSYQCQSIPEPTQERPCVPEPACPPSSEPARPTEPTAPSCPEHKQQQTLFGMDLGDLLLLAVIVLLLLDADEEETLPLLLTAAAFVFLH